MRPSSVLQVSAAPLLLVAYRFEAIALRLAAASQRYRAALRTLGARLAPLAAGARRLGAMLARLRLPPPPPRAVALARAALAQLRDKARWLPKNELAQLKGALGGAVGKIVSMLGQLWSAAWRRPARRASAEMAAAGRDTVELVKSSVREVGRRLGASRWRGRGGDASPRHNEPLPRPPVPPRVPHADFNN